MAFGSIFKPKGQMDIKSPDSSLPGQQIPVEIKVTPEDEIRPREVRVELVGEETFYKTEHHTDTSGHRKTHIVKKDEPFASIVQVVAGQPVLLKGAEQKWACLLQLPADASCTCLGKLVNIRWKLKAVVDVPNRSDLSQEKSIMVLCQSQQVSSSSSAPVEKSFGEVTLLLTAPVTAASGCTIKGQLSLQIKEKLGIRSIRIELVQAEEAGTKTSEEIIAKVQVAGESNFSQYEAPSFDYSVDIPREVPPTSICKHSNLRWKIRAVLDRKMKTDFNVEQEIFLYNASRA